MVWAFKSGVISSENNRGNLCCLCDKNDSFLDERRGKTTDLRQMNWWGYRKERLNRYRLREQNEMEEVDVTYKVNSSAEGIP